MVLTNVPPSKQTALNELHLTVASRDSDFLGPDISGIRGPLTLCSQFDRRKELSVPSHEYAVLAFVALDLLDREFKIDRGHNSIAKLVMQHVKNSSRPPGIPERCSKPGHNRRNATFMWCP